MLTECLLGYLFLFYAEIYSHSFRNIKKPLGNLVNLFT